MQLQENLVIADRFRLVRMIGRGGMGSVWQAVNIALDQPCAVKFIEAELASLGDAQARFQREARAAAQLRSPHVVQIVDHGVWEGRPYIAMELLEGEDLGKGLQRAGGRMHPAQVSHIMDQVCRALTRAHQAGIVHRDLKPDNIFLVTDDDRQIVKILDFGVAKQTSMTIDGSNTKTGAMLGTPYYMSPEQAQGIKGVDARSDLWSLAVIVYQCITGQLPFQSEALGDLLVKIIVHPLPIPSQVANVPPGFDRWWARAADRNPDNRFQTAKEFASSLAVAVGASTPAEVGRHGGGGATAMMANPALASYPGAVVQQPVNTPQNLQYGAPPAAFQSSSGQVQAPAVAAGSPHQTSQPGYALGASRPATFAGVEPPIVLPKKGPPIAILGAIGAAAVIGMILIVVALTHKAPVVTGDPATGSGSAIAHASAPPPAASAIPSAAPPASATAEPAPDPTPTASPQPAPPTDPTPTASAEPAPTTSAAATAAKPTAVVGPWPARPAPKPSAAPSSSAKKWVPGF